jgi:hypothetical protein
MIAAYLIEIVVFLILMRNYESFRYSWNIPMFYIFVCVVINTLIRHHSLWPLIAGILKGAILWIIIIVLAFIVFFVLA